VWIQGRRRLAERQLVDVDLAGLMARVDEWRQRIAAIPRSH
jgi:5-methylthioadenosine/S-adenosylhomocysteine deaminase